MNQPEVAEICEPSAVECREALIALPRGVADLGRGEVRFENGRRAELSAREMELLGYLAAHAGRVISRDEILAQVWHLNPERIQTRTVDMHIVHLRAKLGDDSRCPHLLHTVRGTGYLFTPGPRQQAASFGV